jgi:hypothetical protein
VLSNAAGSAAVREAARRSARVVDQNLHGICRDDVSCGGLQACGVLHVDTAPVVPLRRVFFRQARSYVFELICGARE